MRIISQNGRVDMPYEKIALYLSCEQIVAKHEGTKYLLATYSSEEKAIKAMEMCRKEYKRYLVREGGYNPLSGVTTQPAVFQIPKVFNFPKDEEVEV